MKVHSTLGNGFQEVIYQRAMCIEMDKLSLSFQREMEMTIYYGSMTFDVGKGNEYFFKVHSTVDICRK